jgi:hypothetical protein
MLRAILTVAASIIISKIGATPASAERKIAFVVGIDKYDNLAPLIHEGA